MKYNLIFHITTACNFDCTYCDVIKDNKFISDENKSDIIAFINSNAKDIESFKFFGGEPLLAFQDIKDIISNTAFGDKYSLVTNTSLLKDEVGNYFQNNFNKLFFSIDSENDFNFIKVRDFINKYHLENKVYFNLIISPAEEVDAYKNFLKLYELGLKRFNILPVYFTQPWTKNNLKSLSFIMKNICDMSKKDTDIKLYGFQENIGYETNLFNNVIFIDIDGKIYYSDIVSTFYGQDIKKQLYLGDIKDCKLTDLDNIDFSKKQEIIDTLEKKIYKDVSGQKELHGIMDYFSKYLNTNNL